MSIELAKKNFIDLKKKAVFAINNAGLGTQKAKVAIALDISGSMTDEYRTGIVQRVTERLLALGIKFDDNQAIDVFLFGVNDYEVGELQESDFYQYVDREIYSKYRLESGTNYAGVMNRIVNKYTISRTNTSTSKGFMGMFKKEVVESIPEIMDEPVFVIFITDGDNQDKYDTERVIKEASKAGIFWQFVGIGNSSFDFLEKLDDMPGRYIDNADFFQIQNIGRIDDDQLFNQLLGEFPDWLKEAKSKNLIK